METKSIYELKAEILSKSLELVNDYIYHLELGEERRFTIKDVQRCYDEMYLTMDNGDVSNTFAEILLEGNESRTRKELIELQHRYINLIRKEIGNKPLDFSKDEFMILHITKEEWKNRFDKENKRYDK